MLKILNIKTVILLTIFTGKLAFSSDTIDRQSISKNQLLGAGHFGSVYSVCDQRSGEERQDIA